MKRNQIMIEDLTGIKPAHARIDLRIQREVIAILDGYDSGIISPQDATKRLTDLKPLLDLSTAYWDEYFAFKAHTGKRYLFDQSI